MMNYSDWQEIFSGEWQGLWGRLGESAQIRERYFGRRVSFCVILNAKSGACSEDCAFCSQSGRVKGGTPHYPLLARKKLVAAAKAAAAAGASRFSIVTAGRGLITPREQQAVIEAVAAIRQEAPIQVCASLGIVGRDFLRDLKAAGLYRYHHNLETAASHFPRICSTHTYGERVATIEAAKAAGLSVCAGGILGLGESVAQRWELAQALKDLEVDAIPLNFLHPLPGTALADRPRLAPLTALQAVVAFRLAFPERSLIICGGRQVTLGSLSPLIFAAGADSLMTGDYLTTRGRLPEEDRQVLADLGLELAGK
ncbi:MAG: biotin synthase BioB [Desulfobaccales bacterium]